MTLNIQHGNGAVVVVRGPWIDKDSRKSEANNNAHMAKDGSLLFNTKTGRMCETLREPVKVLKSLSEQATNIINSKDYIGIYTTQSFTF